MLVSSAIFTTVQAEDIQAIASTDEQKTYSRKEAYRASTNRIVLHYGEGMKRAINIAEILNEKGYPTIAVAGGPKNGVTLFVNRGIGKIVYDQDDVDDGTLGSDAIGVFWDRVGKPDLN